MNKFFIFLFLSFFLVGTFGTLAIMASFVRADDSAPNYNFGTMQGGSSLNVAPGQEISTKIYFYNIYGNRPTHIKLNVVSNIKDLAISFLPALSNNSYDVSGTATSVEENLVVYPSNVSTSKGTNTATIEYLNSKVGWIASNFVTINVKVPSEAKAGDSFTFNVTGVAFWLGQTGSIALQQQRDFDYTVTVISNSSTGYYEKPISSNGFSLGKFLGARMQNPVLIIAVGITILLIIVLLILIILMLRRKAKNTKVIADDKKSRGRRRARK